MFDIHKFCFLHHNLISTFSANTFKRLSKLWKLDVRQNNVVYIDSFIFKSMVLLEILETDIFRMCCLVPSTVSCSGGERFVSSCSDLIGRRIQKVLIWAMGIWGLSGNVLVIYMSFYRSHDKPRTVPKVKAYLFLVLYPGGKYGSVRWPDELLLVNSGNPGCIFYWSVLCLYGCLESTLGLQTVGVYLTVFLAMYPSYTFNTGTC